jgi:type II secretory pathway component PulF
MAFLKFEALDSQGKLVSGTMQAGTPSELESLLNQRGLQPVSIEGRRLANAPAVPVVAPVRTAPRPQVRPAPNKNTAIPTSTPRPAPTGVAAPQVTAKPPKTPELSPKALIFFTEQAASFFNSGMGGAQIFQTLGPQMHPSFHPMMQEMANEISAGSTIADAMDKRPLTFPQDFAATIRAGERSGQVGAAFMQVSHTAQRGIAGLRPLSYFFFMAPILLFCAFGGIGIQNASYNAMKRQDAAGGNLSPVGTLTQEIGSKGTMWLLMGLAIAVAFVILRKFFLTRPFRRFRHGVGLSAAPLRTREEAVEKVTWALSVQSRAGIAPSSSVHTALAAIPNQVLRERALANLGVMRENESMADILRRVGVLGAEHIHMVQNAQITGDMPGALDVISRTAEAHHAGHTQKMGVAIGGAATLGMVAFTLIMTLLLYKMYATGLFKLFADQ